MSIKNSRLMYLCKLGFKKTAECIFNNGTIEIKGDLSKQDCLYALTTQESVLYIGKSDDLNRRINEHKKDLLKKIFSNYEHQKITIYVLDFKVKIYLNMLELYIAAGLERSLIRKLKPAFNKQYSSTTSETIKETANDIMKDINGFDEETNLIAKKEQYAVLCLHNIEKQYFFIDIKNKI